MMPACNLDYRMTYHFRVPGSTSNLGAGFDALGLAISRYLHVSLEPARAFSVTVSGTNCASIPKDSNNLILRVAKGVAVKRNRDLPPFRLILQNEIPLARGLGSSAAAIIGGITCYELMTGDLLTDDDLFCHAFEFEPHPDNLAAALYGGLISAATSTSGHTCIAQLTVAAGVTAVVVIPEFELSTETARAVLPDSYSRADVVYNIQRSALTIAALTTGKWSMLREAMRDRVHQPYRAKLIPGLQEILELEIPGLLAVALSGAGPTVFAFVEPLHTNAIGAAIAGTFSKFGVTATPYQLEIDMQGRVINKSDETS